METNHAGVQRTAQAALEALVVAVQPKLETIGNHIAASDPMGSGLHRAAMNTLDTLTAIVETLANLEPEAARAFDDIPPIASRGV